jgi:glycosyltransferase involved in cell wall biosynthesis
MVKNREFANRVEAGIREWKRVSGSPNERDCIAAIACGLPLVARAGWETAEPTTSAGVHLLPEGNTNGYGPALLRVLTDNDYRALLAERSRHAQEQHFSWRAIAAKYVSALPDAEP